MLPPAGRADVGGVEYNGRMTLSRPRRARVTISATASVDGRITIGPGRLLLEPGAGGEWAMLRPPGFAEVAERRRSGLESRLGRFSILEGSGSFVTPDAPPRGDPPPLTEPPVDNLPSEVLDRPEHERWFVVVDSRGRVDWTTAGEGGTDLLVLVARHTPADYLAELRRKGICFLVAGDGRVDLVPALERLRDRLGIEQLVAESGGGLNAALLAAGVVDELQLLVLPAIVGGADTPSLVDGPSPLPRRLQLLESSIGEGGVVELRYAVADEE